MKEILQALKTVAHKWEQLGLQLDVPPSDLESIKADNKDNVSDRLRSVVSYWLKDVEHPTKQTLLKALETVGEKNLAKNLREEWSTARSRQAVHRASMSEYSIYHPFITKMLVIYARNHGT